MGIKIDVLKMLLFRPSATFKKHSHKEVVDGEKIRYTQIDNTSLCIIFDNGYGTPMKLWDEVFCQMAKTHTVFAYNRDDKKDKQGKKVSIQKVETLRKLLKIRGLKPPYLLVGHSLGGLYMQYFAKKYPQEVAGVVLVDSPQPESFDNLSVMPSKTPKSMFALFKEISAFGKEVKALPTTTVPMVAIIASSRKFITQYPEKAKMQEWMIEKEKEFPSLYPNCKIELVDCGHMVMYEKPDVVIESIKSVLEELS